MTLKLKGPPYILMCHPIYPHVPTIYPHVPPTPPATSEAFPEGLLPSVIPFWKPLMTPDLDPNSDAKILQIFLQPIFATPQNEHF